MPGKAGLQLYDRQEIFDKLGIWPEQVTDYKGLCGDTSDNIPGIRGIGPKTAQQLLSSYGNIDGIYNNINEIKAKALYTKLVEGEDIARQSKALATVRYDVPIEFDFAHCHLTPPDKDALSGFFLGLEFKNLTARLPKVLANFSMASIENKSVIQEKSISKDSSSETTNVKIQKSAEVLQEQIIESEDQLKDLVDKLSKKSLLGIYINASPWTPLSNDAIAYGEPQIYGYSLAWDAGLAYIPIRLTALALGAEPGLSKQFVHDQLSKIFANETIGKTVFDYKHVLNLLDREDLSLVNVLLDPMLASYICSSDEKHGLLEQASRLFDYISERVDQKKSAKKQRASWCYHRKFARSNRTCLRRRFSYMEAR